MGGAQTGINTDRSMGVYLDMMAVFQLTSFGLNIRYRVLQVCADSVCVMFPMISHACKGLAGDTVPNGFQIVGVDVLLGAGGDPHLMEV